MAYRNIDEAGQGDDCDLLGLDTETIATSRSSTSDTKFDAIIGHIEDIVMDEEFQSKQQKFLEKYCREFDDSEENKLIYTDIHEKYTELIEKHLESALKDLVPDFDMVEFQKQLVGRRDELEGEIFEILLTFSDFLEFKEMCLAYKAELEGRTVDLSAGIVISSLCIDSLGSTRSQPLNGSAANYSV